MLRISGSRIIDDQGRTVQLRGVNLGGSSKVPTIPDGSTYRSEGFFEHRKVSFVGRPFPLEGADEHYKRLRSWGFNCLRFLMTWEAVEHEGPGIYDNEYLEYLYHVVKKAGEYGFCVFIDPHQDVWSRFSGGDGAPGWTLEIAGFDITGFKETGAAVVHQTHGDPFPRMIWPTNAYKLAAGTMYTLFFAGNDFAPITKVDGFPIQDYLQAHFFGAIRKVAEKLKGLDCVIGYDTFNEPQRGFVGISDLRDRFGDLPMGTFPTPWQSILLGAGYSQQVEILRRGIFNPIVTGRKILNKVRKSAWLPGRTCIWQENGVWDVGTGGEPVLLKPGHFSGVRSRRANFVQDYLLPFNKKFTEMIHGVNPEALIFMESEVENDAPVWPDASSQNIVYAPHWYDGVTLLFKRYIPWLGSDLFKKSPVFGQRQIRKSYAAQMKKIRDNAISNLGDVPVILGEFGIPFDLDKKLAYRTGDFTNQIKAMERSMQAIEKNLLHFTLWNYTADNCNAYGDRWNDEDLSIFSRDQQGNPTDINSGGRALQTVVRPFPVATCGEPISLEFNPFSGYFKFSFRSDPDQKNPSLIYTPDLQYPGGIDIQVSDGYTLGPVEQVISYFAGELTTHTITFTRK